MKGARSRRLLCTVGPPPLFRSVGAEGKMGGPPPSERRGCAKRLRYRSSQHPKNHPGSVQQTTQRSEINESICKTKRHLNNQPTNPTTISYQPTIQPSIQSINQRPSNKLNNHLINQPSKQSINRTNSPTNHLFTKPTNQSVHTQINQATNQLSNQSTNKRPRALKVIHRISHLLLAFFSFLLFFPVACFVESNFLERISRIRSKKACG